MVEQMKKTKPKPAKEKAKVRRVKIGKATLYCGDSLKVLPRIARKQAENGKLGFHACVCDPPYLLGFMGKRWDTVDGSDVKKYDSELADIAFDPFMPPSQAFHYEWAKAVVLVLRPGAHILAFGGDRTYHRMACAIEDAGCDIRNMLAWVYGQGMPHGMNIGMTVNKKLRGRPQGTADPDSPNHKRLRLRNDGQNPSGSGYSVDGKQAKARHAETEGWHPEALEFHGFNTALKPALEPICVARTPMRLTATDNMMKFHTGAFNVKACRVPSAGGKHRVGEASQNRRYTTAGSTNFANKPGPRNGAPEGRYPANFVHDGSDEVVELFPDTKSGKAVQRNGGGQKIGGGVTGIFGGSKGLTRPDVGYEDSGSAARFFYCAKASKKDRDYGMDGVAAKPFIQFQTANGTSGKASSLSAGRNTEYRNTHPTVKPLALMKWLVNLATWPGGTVLDPFMGSGSTGIAAILEGHRFVGIEQDPAYFEIACRRIAKAVEEREALEKALAKAETVDTAKPSRPVAKKPMAKVATKTAPNRKPSGRRRAELNRAPADAALARM